MAKKRFTDIEIWDKEWFMQLTPTMKCLMKYLHDKCDASGCWKPNWKLASVHINEDVTESDLQNLPSDQYEILKNGKIFIPDFIKFQYGTLSDKSPAHKPIFIAIEKNNLSDRVFNRVSNTLQEKDIYMDKEEERDMDMEKEEERPPDFSDFKTKPVAADFNGLPDIIAGSVIQLMKITKQTDVTTADVNGLWDVFKVQNLTGKKYYKDKEGVYSHFINWSKTQKIDHGTGKQQNTNQQSGYRDSVKEEHNRRYGGRG